MGCLSGLQRLVQTFSVVFLSVDNLQPIYNAQCAGIMFCTLHGSVSDIRSDKVIRKVAASCCSQSCSDEMACNDSFILQHSYCVRSHAIDRLYCTRTCSACTCTCMVQFAQF